MQCADIRVCDAGDGARFVAEPFNPPAWRVHELAREKLDGNDPIKSRIARTIDFTHPSGAQRRQDLEWAESDSRGEPHRDRQEYSDSMVEGPSSASTTRMQRFFPTVNVSATS